jgi:hypothetical protein
LKCSEVEIRLEKGYFHPRAQQWHRDGSQGDWRYFTICWSNKLNWSTYVLDEKTNHMFSDTEIMFANEGKREFVEKIDAVAKAAKFGYFYNSKNLLHRGPKIEDLGSAKIAVDDYRLFLRFTGR